MIEKSVVVLFSLLFLVCFSSQGQAEKGNRLVRAFEAAYAEVEGSDQESEPTAEGEGKGLQRATFGNGCFWCTEAVFEELKGVGRVASGYSGGRVPNPTYQQVCTGLTGHAEVVHLEFDPEVISYAKLLEVFWRTHDPTTKNRQGPDVGTQYRSAIFYHNEDQRDLARKFKAKLNDEHAFRKPIVTEITKFKSFYAAKGYHQDYFAKNGRAPYCRQVIRPKLSKFRRVFADDLERNKRDRKEE